MERIIIAIVLIFGISTAYAADVALKDKGAKVAVKTDSVPISTAGGTSGMEAIEDIFGLITQADVIVNRTASSLPIVVTADGDTNPGVNDDIDTATGAATPVVSGYIAGDVWINDTASPPTVWRCLLNTDTDAKWKELTGSNIYQPIDSTLTALAAGAAGEQIDFSSHPLVDADIEPALTLNKLDVTPLAAMPTPPALGVKYWADSKTWNPAGSDVTIPYETMIVGSQIDLFDDPLNGNFDSDAPNWANGGLAVFNDTTDLSLEADGIGDYAVLPVAEAPMTNTQWYVLEFDVTSLVDSYTITDFDEGFTIGTISATGTHQRILFQYNDATGGGLRFVAVTATSDINIDNITLEDAIWKILITEDAELKVDTIAAGMVVNTAAAGFTLTAAQMNSVWEMSGAGDVLIPADQCNSPGKWLTVISTAAHQNAIDFVDGDDDFYLSDGSEVDGAANELLLGGAAGNLVTLLCTSTANKWRVVGEIGTCTSQADD